MPELVDIEAAELEHGRAMAKARAEFLEVIRQHPDTLEAYRRWQDATDRHHRTVLDLRRARREAEIQEGGDHA